MGRVWERGRRFAATPRGKRLLWGARQALTIGVAAYLVYRMSLIGWTEIWKSLPRNPWFYVVFLGVYFSLPFFQAVGYKMIWHTPLTHLLPAMLKKGVYDKDILDRSGDVYVYFWGRTNLDHSDHELLHHVKDNAIVSSVAATLIAIVLLGGFLATGSIALPDVLARHELAYGIAGGVLLVVLVAAGIRFRQRVFLLPARLLALLFGIHFARVCVLRALQVVEWNVGVPDVPLDVWFTFLAVQIITAHIPLLPGRDLVFMAAGIELAGAVEVSGAAIAGLLGAHSVLDKILNLTAFAGVSAWERKEKRIGDIIETGTPSAMEAGEPPEDPVVETASSESSSSP